MTPVRDTALDAVRVASPEGVTLRPMTADDVDAVMALERALFPADAWTEGMLRDELAEVATRHYIVAVTDEGGPVGYAGLRFVPPEGDVQTMAVAASAWGRGIGGALLTGLLDQAARRGVTHMFLEVRSDNPRAQKLYGRFGFERIGVRHGYYNGADALVMRRVAEEGTHE
ncbi:ribosomal protein S18-alanine N-acetyltransferase [Nocardiopsis sp. DSM 44743]|uniref:Ribosomal protein S18-alanine N-acetyltransferase n=1 Tax=Nocardiopsis lambiniae TaxID=3075539 RepID=A0ABU2M8Q6_9ACTN|nr:ribosomal protein S18-alanine N-acetyltransferase [Nocardiopsis sp. DSM 44743]MDT0329058.1 ribosomal protein S18-alanine N-acetyltransferase [Nocardiopsis sp. DSM 44743]